MGVQAMDLWMAHTYLRVPGNKIKEGEGNEDEG